MKKTTTISTRQSVGADLKQERKKQGFTQQEIADLMKCKRQVVSRMETGKSNYGIDLLLAYKKALGIY